MQLILHCWDAPSLHFAVLVSLKLSGGIGHYEKSFPDYIRRIGTDNVEDLRLNNVRCKITNRLAIGMSTLKLGSGELGAEDGGSLLLGELALVSDTVMGNRVLTAAKAEKIRIDLLR